MGPRLKGAGLDHQSFGFSTTISVYFSITWPPVTGMAWPVSYFCSTQ